MRKGTVDTISDGETTLVCDEPGSNRRAGGHVHSPTGSIECVQGLVDSEMPCITLLQHCKMYKPRS